jgi:hypothetical protein
MTRAHSIKKQWHGFLTKQKETGTSYLNIGRMSLVWYLEYCYKSYQALCKLTGEKPPTYAKWLTWEIKDHGTV